VHAEPTAFGILDVLAEFEDGGVGGQRDVERVAYRVGHHHRAGFGCGAHRAVSSE
jgi:hypothetical protein